MIQARDYSEDLCPFVEKDKVGYRNVFNGYTITPRFDYAGMFHDKRGLVHYNKRVGFVDCSGDFVIEPKYSRASSFSEGLSLVLMVDSPYPLLIDTSGRVFDSIDYGKYDILYPPSEGLIAARIHGTSHKGYLNHEGQEVIPFIYDDISTFKNGHAYVGTSKNGSRIINNQGITLDYWKTKEEDDQMYLKKLHKFRSCIEIVEVKEKEDGGVMSIFKGASFRVVGYRILRNGLPVGRVYHSVDHVLYSGRSRVSILDSNGFEKYGLVDANGNLVCRPVFDLMNTFNEGLAQVAIGHSWKKYGFLDPFGRSTIDHLLRKNQ